MSEGPTYGYAVSVVCMRVVPSMSIYVSVFVIKIWRRFPSVVLPASCTFGTSMTGPCKLHYFLTFHIPLRPYLAISCSSSCISTISHDISSTLPNALRVEHPRMALSVACVGCTKFQR